MNRPQARRRCRTLAFYLGKSPCSASGDKGHKSTPESNPEQLMTERKYHLSAPSPNLSRRLVRDDSLLMAI